MADRSHAERVARSVDEAREIILAAASPLPEIELSLANALGLTLPQPLIATQDSPPFATAAMDGFAIQSGDVRSVTSETPVRLTVAGVQPAGDAVSIELAPGTAIRIMTGAPCPPGADAVVPFEGVTERSEVIDLSEPIATGANIRPQGEEHRAGEQLLEAGTTLTPARLALLAANGRSSVSVHAAARVAVFAAGNELRRPGEPLGAGQIWDSNSVMVAALCQELGATVVMASLVSDREDEIAIALAMAEQSDVDLIVTVGGISAGDYDHLKHVLTSRGAVELWDVAMRPGRPLAFGKLKGVPVIGLPGNPAAAFVSFHQFVRPLLARLMGRATDAQMVTATAGESFLNRGGRRSFVRVTVSPTETSYLARGAGSQSSASILSLARANGLLVIPESVDRVEAGDKVQVQLLSPVPCPLAPVA